MSVFMRRGRPSPSPPPSVPLPPGTRVPVPDEVLKAYAAGTFTFPTPVTTVPDHATPKAVEAGLRRRRTDRAQELDPVAGSECEVCTTAGEYRHQAYGAREFTGVEAQHEVVRQHPRRRRTDGGRS